MENRLLPFVLFAEPSPACCCPDQRPVVASFREGRELLSSAQKFVAMVDMQRWDTAELISYFRRLLHEYYSTSTPAPYMMPVIRRLGRWLACDYQLDGTMLDDWCQRYPLTAELRPDCVTEWDWWDHILVPLRCPPDLASQRVADVADPSGDWRVACVTDQVIVVESQHIVGGSPISGARFRYALERAVNVS